MLLNVRDSTPRPSYYSRTLRDFEGAAEYRSAGAAHCHWFVSGTC